MKKIIYLLLLFSVFANAQIVNIPDANFKTRLLQSSTTVGTARDINGNNMAIDANLDGEIQVSEALLVYGLYISSYGASNNILSFTGINSFTNLVGFGASFNQASINIDGLLNLKTIGISNNMNNGPSVFNNLPALTSFQFQNSSVSSITVSNCPNIVNMYMQQNANLTNLNIGLIPALKKIWGWSCKINSLSILNSPLLEEADFHSNSPLSSVSIPNSPNLKDLNLAGNNIADFSGIASSLGNIEYLSLKGNYSPPLIFPTSMPNLESISINGNSLSNINFSNHPLLSSISLGQGDIATIDVSGVPLLYQLMVSGNNISSIDLSNNNLINNLAFSDCPITSLDLSNQSVLVNFNCSGLLISELDLSNSPTLSTISFENNLNLTHINLKSGTTNVIYYSDSMYYNLPNLSYICVDEGDVMNFGILSAIPDVLITSYCSFTPGGNYNTITGAIIYDGNGNGCEATDLPHPNIKVDINNGTNQGSTFTNNTGNYKFYTEAGSFNVTPNMENPAWFSVSPATVTIPFANDNNNTTTQNFCITPNGVHPDLEIVIAPIVPARPGFDAVYKIVYKNKGNQTLSGGINFQYNDANLDFVSSTTVPNSQATGNLVWNYTNLLPFESRSVTVTLNVNSPTETPAVNINDVLSFTATVTPTMADETVLDNVFQYNQTVVGAFDPNDITCLEGNVVPPSLIGEYLHYGINFENTGNFEAENIVVKVEVNAADFDINSLRLLNTSHNSYTKVTGNVVEFIFENIALSSGGHGNILLKVRSKNNLVVGDLVAKNAKIYFDYNAPILTNLESTVFQSLSNGDFVLDNSVAFFPNPTKDKINVSATSNIKNIHVYDVQGRLLETGFYDNVSATVDLSRYNHGIYLLKINTDNGASIQKVIKE